MTIVVERVQMPCTVQDRGRFGHRSRGIGTAGAADGMALATANLLVGNHPGAAALEFPIAGPVLRFERNATIALAGADLGLRVAGVSQPAWEAVGVPAGARVDFTGRRSGCRAVLAVAGGIDVPPTLGSRSTDLRAGIGGIAGRALVAGDRLPIGPPARAPAAPGRSPAAALRYRGGGGVRFVAGPEVEWFTAAARAALVAAPYTLTAASDRMGCRLTGTPLPLTAACEMRSQALVPGTIQVPPGGAPIVLLADAPVTGGYPRIGVVIAADLPIVAQTMPGESLRFVEVDRAEALRLARQQRRDLDRFALGIALGIAPGGGSR